PLAHSIALRLAGDAIEEVDDHGARIIDDTLLIVMSAEAGPITFTLPTHPRDVEWELIVDTRSQTGKPAKPVALPGDAEYGMEGSSLALLKSRKRNNPPAFMSNIAVFSRRRRPGRER